MITSWRLTFSVLSKRLTARVSDLPIPILLVGAVLRISGLMASTVWYDEAWTIFMNRLPLFQMVQLMGEDVNPPAWGIMIKPFVALFGELAGIRVLSLLASLAMLYLAWQLIQRFIPSDQPWQRVVASLLVAVVPAQLWMAQDGRVYALLSLLYLVALWMALEGRWWGLGAACALMAYSHYTGPFYALVALLVGYLTHRDQWRRVAIAGLGAAVSYLPWVSQQAQMITTGDYVPFPLSFNHLMNCLVQMWFVGTLRNGIFLLAGFMVLGTILLALVLSMEPVAGKEWNSPILPLGLAAIGPFGLIMIGSLAVTNALVYRGVAPLLVPMAIWFAKTLTPKRITWTTWVLPYTWALVLVVALVSWSPTLRGSDLAQQIQNLDREWRSGDVIYHATGSTYMPVALLTNKPAFVLDEEQNRMLVPTPLTQALGIEKKPLEEIPHHRVWIFWARDELMSPQAQERMAEYVEGAQLVGTVYYWQMANFEIYLKEEVYGQ